MGAITFRNAGKMVYYRIHDQRWLALAHASLALQDPRSAERGTA